MSKEVRPTLWICDICGHKEEHMNVPNWISTIRADISRSGFAYAFQYDVCKTCLPSEYFSDPISKKQPPEKVKVGLFKLILSKKNLIFRTKPQMDI